MSEENKAVVRWWTEEGFGEGNLAVADEVVADDFIKPQPRAGQMPGREGLKRTVTVLRATFPDLRVEIEDLIAEGDRGVLRDTIRGTHQGPFAGISPTGKQVTVARIAVFRFVDGKISEQWANVDVLGLMQQLGVIPPPPEAE